MEEQNGTELVPYGKQVGWPYTQWGVPRGEEEEPVIEGEFRELGEEPKEAWWSKVKDKFGYTEGDYSPTEERVDKAAEARERHRLESMTEAERQMERLEKRLFEADVAEAEQRKRKAGGTWYQKAERGRTQAGKMAGTAFKVTTLGGKPSVKAGSKDLYLGKRPDPETYIPTGMRRLTTPGGGGGEPTELQRLTAPAYGRLREASKLTGGSMPISKYIRPSRSLAERPNTSKLRGEIRLPKPQISSLRRPPVTSKYYRKKTREIRKGV